MNIRTLMLGTVLACGTSFGAQAADAVSIGEVVALDICDTLGLSGLTIGSNDTCLRISGLVEYELLWGDYQNTRYAENFRGGAINFFNPDPAGDLNWDSSVDWRLRLEAVSQSDFGRALAFLQLEEDGDDEVQFAQAYVQIGDQTVLSAGRKGTIFDTGDSRVHNNFLGLFSSTGTGGPSTSGNSHVIQISSTVAEGVVVSAGLEALNSATPRAVGVVELSGGWGSGHLSVAANEAGEWKLHTAAQFGFDDFDLTTVVAADDTGFWNALVSGQYEFDLFTISGGVQYAEGGGYDQQWGAGAQISADVTDTVAINLGSRYLTNTVTSEDIWQIALGTEVDIADNLVLDARIGYVNSSYASAPVGNSDFAYGDVELRYRPGGGTQAALGVELNTTGAWRANFSLEKSF